MRDGNNVIAKIKEKVSVRLIFINKTIQVCYINNQFLKEAW